MPRRPIKPSRNRTRIVAATVASAALAGVTLAAPPASAQDADATEVPPAPEPPPGETPPDTAPPTTLPSLPVADAPADVPASGAVRSGYAVDAPVAAPSTELPRAADPTDEPSTDEPEPTEGRHAPGTTPKAPREPRSRRGAADDDERAATKPSRVPEASSTTVTGAAPPQLPSQHTVVAGEHLWSIAAVQLGAASGRAPDTLTAVEIAPYWTQLCMLNAPRLQSGDLNLVYPGEVLELPPM